MDEHTLQIAATFTAEPLRAVVKLLLETLELPTRIEFAPFNQVFQELLTSTSSFFQNRSGVNVLLVRLQDLSESSNEEKLVTNGRAFAAAVRTAVQRSLVPTVLVFCPASGEVLASEKCQLLMSNIERDLVTELEGLRGLHLIRSEQLCRLCPATEYDNPRGERLGAVPYTSQFYSILGRQLARTFYGLIDTRHKVIVLDCDQTLWKGVCGEDGPDGIELDMPRKFLQQFMLDQHEAGMLLCLASKNNESDVWQVFDGHPDMVLKRDHIVSSRISWQLKSDNIKSLASELQLGLDTFIFVDDDPVVCAEVESRCPEVLTICLPQEIQQIPEFFSNHWAFDHLRVTDEDSQRTRMYRDNAKRNRLQEQVGSLEDFLQVLDLQCEITPASPEDLPRVAQLTQRTNQFNATTIRRSENEIQQLLSDSEGQCLVVHVRDRFGDYGLVGALIYSARECSLTVETFLLSCRALGRGVEHQMLSALGHIAAERQMDYVAVNFVRSKKNLPAKDFLEKTGGAFKQDNYGSIVFRYPTEVALHLSYTPETTKLDTKELTSEAIPHDGSVEPEREWWQTRASGLCKIAAELHRPEALMAYLKPAEATRPALDIPYVEAVSEVEKTLVSIWEKILNVHPVGVLDDFFELGGDSLGGVSLFVEVEEAFSKELPLATLFVASTVRSLARCINGSEQKEQWRYLVPIQPQGTRPPLYCMHAAGGNVLFYRDLSRHLGLEQPVYGLQAREMEDTGTYLNRVEDMATHYMREMLTLQTEGPYYICGSSFGGLIAYEVAQQLKLKGKEVALLALFDTYGPGYPQMLSTSSALSQKLGRLTTRLVSVRGRLQQMDAADISQFIRAKTRKGSIKVKRKWLWKKNEFQINYARATGRELPKDMQRNHKAIQQALEKYIPRPYDGRLVLYRASMQPKGIVPDPNLGWEGLPLDGIDLHESPGTHGAMTVDPYAKPLATQLAPLLASDRENLKTTVRFAPIPAVAAII